MRFRSSMLVCFLALLSWKPAAAQFARQRVVATPQRPSNSFNTSIVPKGWLEVEFGTAIDEHFVDSPVVFKLGLQPNMELFAGVSPLVHVSDAPSQTGFGDVSFGLRTRFGGGQRGLPSFGGVISVKIPTADEKKGLGSGHTDWTFLVVVSQATPKFSVDLNIGFRSTSLPEGNNDSQFIAIVTGGRSLSKKMSGYAEIFLTQHAESSGIGGGFNVNQAVLVGAGGVSYAVSDRFVLDAGLNINLVNAGYDVQFLVGATSTLFKLW